MIVTITMCKDIVILKGKLCMYLSINFALFDGQWISNFYASLKRRRNEIAPIIHYKYQFISNYDSYTHRTVYFNYVSDDHYESRNDKVIK